MSTPALSAGSSAVTEDPIISELALATKTKTKTKKKTKTKTKTKTIHVAYFGRAEGARISHMTFSPR